MTVIILSTARRPSRVPVLITIADSLTPTHRPVKPRKGCLFCLLWKEGSLLLFLLKISSLWVSRVTRGPTRAKGEETKNYIGRKYQKHFWEKQNVVWICRTDENWVIGNISINLFVNRGKDSLAMTVFTTPFRKVVGFEAQHSWSNLYWGRFSLIPTGILMTAHKHILSTAHV